MMGTKFLMLKPILTNSEKEKIKKPEKWIIVEGINVNSLFYNIYK